MMSLTALLALGALILLAIVFIVSYMIKGLKVALITTGVAFIMIAALVAALIYLIVNSMPN